jgi:lipoate synthase
MSSLKEKDIEQYKKDLKRICEYSPYCPGCGMTPEGFEELERHIRNQTLYEVLDFARGYAKPMFEPRDIHESGKIVGYNEAKEEIRQAITNLIEEKR